MPSEINHILRLSRLMEYASPEHDFNWGSSQESKVKEYYRPGIEGLSLKLDMTLALTFELT